MEIACASVERFSESDMEGLAELYAPDALIIAPEIVGAYRIVGGKIAEARFFWDFDEALAAVGLRE